MKRRIWRGSHHRHIIRCAFGEANTFFESRHRLSHVFSEQTCSFFKKNLMSFIFFLQKETRPLLTPSCIAASGASGRGEEFGKKRKEEEERRQPGKKKMTFFIYFLW